MHMSRPLSPGKMPLNMTNCVHVWCTIHVYRIYCIPVYCILQAREKVKYVLKGLSLIIPPFNYIHTVHRYVCCVHNSMHKVYMIIKSFLWKNYFLMDSQIVSHENDRIKKKLTTDIPLTTILQSTTICKI